MHYREPELDIINVIDIEATCWLGDSKNTEKREIIEIGITELNIHTGSITSYSYLVYPTTTDISVYCQELTGITQEDINNKSLPFPDACEILKNKHRSKHRIWASFGDYDREIFEKQCKQENIEYPFGKTHHNIKSLFSFSRRLNEEVGMVEALRIAGLTIIGRLHSGKDDSSNVARLFWQLLCLLQRRNGNWGR